MTTKSKFKVTASMITDMYTIVEADNEDDAIKLAEDCSDAYEWKEDGDWASGAVKIDDASEVK